MLAAAIEHRVKRAQPAFHPHFTPTSHSACVFLARFIAPSSANFTVTVMRCQ